MEKLIVGVIGLGMGALHLKGAIEGGAEIALICDSNPEKLKKVGDEQGIPEERRTGNWLDIVNNKEINAVIIATPDQQHREQIETLLAAGKHIMCEKPLALTREDINAIVKAVNAHPECKFMIGQICRFTPSFVKAKELIDAGRLGEIYFVESEYAHDYLHLYEENPGNWRQDPIRHGVVGGGCHAVDLLRWLVGEDPNEVFAYGNHKLLTEHIPYDDATVSLLKFPGNIMGKVFVSTGCKRAYTMRTCIYGTKGTIVMDNSSPTFDFWEADENGHGAGSKPQVIEIEVNNHNAIREFASFQESLLSGTPITMTVEEGAKTVAACLAIVESSEQGGAIVHPDYDFTK